MPRHQVQDLSYEPHLLGRPALAWAVFPVSSRDWIPVRRGRSVRSLGTAGNHWSRLGAFDPFVDYVKVLNPWAPAGLAWLLGVAATALEVVLAALLLIGWRQRETALASGALLGAFGLAMLCFTGPKAPLDYSVFSACAAALLLAERR